MLRTNRSTIRHFTGHHAKNVFLDGLTEYAKVKCFVRTAFMLKCWVKAVWAIARRQTDKRLTFGLLKSQAANAGQLLGYRLLPDLPPSTPLLWRDAVDLVHEHEERSNYLEFLQMLTEQYLSQ